MDYTYKDLNLSAHQLSNLATSWPPFRAEAFASPARVREGECFRNRRAPYGYTARVRKAAVSYLEEREIFTQKRASLTNRSKCTESLLRDCLASRIPRVHGIGLQK